MANTIIVKRSSVAGKVPLSTDLQVGELAVNLADQKIYSKNAAGTVVQLGGGSGSGDVVGPSSATNNAITRYDGTTGKLVKNSSVLIDDSGNITSPLSINMADGTAVTVAAGRLWYNATTGSWNLGMGGGNITQQVGEELFVYGKASSAISDTNLQLVYQTGVVGASGVIQFAPTVSGITDSNLIIGVATESIALNGFGRVTAWGIVHGIETTGSAYGETWANGDVIWYNPTTGGLTKTKPSAPNIKVQVGTIINAGSGGSGSFSVEINHGSVLGGTDSNVQLNGVSSGNLLIYDATAGYWKNANITAGTGISVSNGAGSVTITNTAPDQTVALTGSGATTVTGTYPNFTISSTNTTYSPATSTVAGLIELASDTVQSTAANAVTSTASRTYGLQVNASGQGVVNVPWTDTVYTLPAATSTVLGGIELGSDTVQTTAANAVTSTASRTYALQVNASGQGVVNVPWTDTNSGGTVTSVATGTGLSGGPITTTGTISLANTTVTAGSYTNANITVDAQGRLTAASSGSGGSGTVTSVGGTGTVAGITLSGTVTTSGNLTLGGTFALPNGQVTGKMIYDSFTATASQTTFTTSQTYTSGKIQVFVNGVKLVNGSDCTVTSGTSVVMASGLPVNTRVDLVYPI